MTTENAHCHAIVMAGGRGQRLMPLTEHRPKALVMLGGRPMLEIVLCQLAATGFSRVTLCTGHLSEMIRERIDDGRRFGLDVDYTVDTQPSGTAGALHLIEEWTTPALIMNCDILTTIDFARVHTAHVRSGCVFTVVAKQDDLAIQSGVLNVIDGRVRGVWEKPMVRMHLAAGVYVADPSVRCHLPPEVPTDMPDLVTSLIADGLAVNAYPWTGDWLDMGTIDSLAEAARRLDEQPERHPAPDGEGRTTLTLREEAS